MKSGDSRTRTGDLLGAMKDLVAGSDIDSSRGRFAVLLLRAPTI